MTFRTNKWNKYKQVTHVKKEREKCVPGERDPGTPVQYPAEYFHRDQHQADFCPETSNARDLCPLLPRVVRNL